MRHVSVLLLGLTLAAAPRAHGQATPYLTLEDWAAPLVEHLIRAGVIEDPDPLTRPLTQGAVLRAIAAADTARLPADVRATLALLADRLEGPTGEPRYRLDLYLEGAGASQDRRNALWPAGDAWAAGGAGMVMRATMGPMVFSARPYLDWHLDDDPEWTGDRAIVDLPGRFTDVYLGLQTRYATVTFGSVARNWGVPGETGLLVSDVPYTYDHLALRLGSDRLRIESILTQLDGMPSPAGAVINRFFVAHRVTFRPVRAFQFAIGTGTVYRGVGAGWDPRFLNPFKLPRVTAVDEALPDSANSAYLGDLRVVLPGGAVATAHLLMDDWDVNPSVRSLPDRFAGGLSLSVPVRPTVSARLAYSGVSSLTYRTNQGPDFSFLRNGIGLGRNHSDFTAARAALSVLARPDLLVEPELVWLRQGESELSDPYPASADATYPFLFVGVVETTWRLATRARMALGDDLDVVADGALHLRRNAGHVAGASDTELHGSVRVRWRFFSGDWR